MFRIISTKKLKLLREKAPAWQSEPLADNVALHVALEQKQAAEERASAAEKELAALKRPKVTLYCSFCGKSQHHVKKLIAGPTTFICDECVNLCIEIVNDTTQAEADLKLLDKAITAYFGERCADQDADCFTCRAWAYVDKLVGRTVEPKAMIEEEMALVDKIDDCRNRLASIIGDIESKREVAP